MKHAIRKGTQFRSIVADENCLWEVTRVRGNDVYEAQVVNEPLEINGEMYDSDHAGMVNVFQGEDIRRTLAFDDFWQKLKQEGDEFYDSLAIGDIVHYHNGFGQFVRCEVVKDAEGAKLKPIALVGEWKVYDLPRRMATGEVRYPYHAQKIREGETFRPAASNLFENPKFSEGSSKGIDPRTLDPIDLELPDLTPVEETHYAKNRFLNAITETIGDDELTLDETIDRIRTMLDGESPWEGY